MDRLDDMRDVASFDPDIDPRVSLDHTPLKREKFADPAVTARGEPRASVPLKGVETLWFNTGTLCNIECANCYIESSPSNDRLVYITRAEVADYLDQAKARGWPVTEVGFTGGEPFMNREMIGIAEETLSRGYRCLILTNAMRPMMRPRVREGLLDLQARYGDALTLRISLDHHSEALHDAERGKGAFAKAIEGLKWLTENGFRLDAAGRTCWGEEEAASRAGYAALFEREGIAIDANDRSRCILFPEMDERVDVPEITTACWGILGKDPGDVMCATSRMVVKRKGAARPAVLACTLLPYDERFELGETLAQAEGPIPLNHPHCAKFCVLGGGSCTA